MRKWLKRILVVLVILLLLLGTITYSIFRSSKVQTYLVNQITHYINDEYDVNINIKGVDFHLFKTFEFEELLVKDHKQDTLLYTPEFYVGLSDFQLDDLQFSVNELSLNKPRFNMVQYSGDTLSNLKTVINKFSGNKPKSGSSPFNLDIEDILIEDGSFSFVIQDSLPKEKGFDPNHIFVNSIYTEISGINFSDQKIAAHLSGLKAQHKNGINLNQLSTDFLIDSNGLSIKGLKLSTQKSNVMGNIHIGKFSYGKQEKEKLGLSFDIPKATIIPQEFSSYLPQLENIDQPVIISVNAETKRKRLKVKKINVSFEHSSHLSGKIDIDDYTNINESFIYGKLQHMSTTYEDLYHIFSAFPSSVDLDVFDRFKALRIVEFSGDYSGFMSDFVAYGTFHTNLGSIKTDIEVNNREDELIINGNLATNNYELGKLLDLKDIGNISLSGNTKAIINPNNQEFDFDGTIQKADFRNYTYRNIKLNAQMLNKKFTGSFAVKDTFVEMNFDGGIDFSGKRQIYDFDADIYHAQPSQLGWLKRDSSLCVSGRLKMNLTGDNFEDLDGDVLIKDLDWYESGKMLYAEEIRVHAVKGLDREMIAFDSDWFKGKIEGDYTLSQLYSSVFNVIARDMPSIVDWRYSPDMKSQNNDFRIMIAVKDFSPIQKMFIEDLTIPEGTLLSARFNEKEQYVHFNFKADSIQYGKKKIEGISLYAHNRDSSLQMNLKSSFIEILDTIGLHDVYLSSKTSNNQLDYSIGWDNSAGYTNIVNLEGFFDISRIDSIGHVISKSEVNFKDTVWTIDPQNAMVFYEKKTFFENFEWKGGNQYFAIRGNTSPKKMDSVMIELKHFDFVNFSSFIDRFGLDITGKATGKVKLYALLGQPYFSGDIVIDDFSFNKQKFGAFKLRSKYDPKQEKIHSKVAIDNLSDIVQFNTLDLEGDYYPFDDNRIDYTLNIRNLKIKFLENYVEGIFSNMDRGKVSGNFDISGNLKAPDLDGMLRLDQVGFKVDYTNVNYTADAQEINFKNNRISFNDFTIGHNTFKDSKAIINGHISHDYFKDIKLQLKSIQLQEFIGLDTKVEHNSTYYGRAFVNGDLSITGPVDDILFKGTLITEAYEDQLLKDNTVLVLPLDDVDELEVSDFIEFVNLSDTISSEKVLAEDAIDLKGLSLNLNFLVNEKAQVKIIFDPTLGEEIKVRGNGDINMNISSTGNFQMNGDYVISDGSYHFTLQNFISRKFFVKPGSTISWDGDPTKGNLDILTYYQTRSKLITLIDSNRVANYNELQNRFQGRVPVNTNLMLKGNMFSPTINMGISLPQGSPEEQEVIDTYILGEDEINRQAFALLLTGQFLPPNNGLASNVDVNTGIDNGVQFIEGQINNALGGIFNNVDLGFDYNTGDTLSAAELRLLVGFHYKSFSVSTDYDINNDVGDIQVELRITDEVKARAFHKRTEQTVLDNGVNTIQGMGLVYEKAFDSFKELIQRRKPPKVEKEKN